MIKTAIIKHLSKYIPLQVRKTERIGATESIMYLKQTMYFFVLSTNYSYITIVY